MIETNDPIPARAFPGAARRLRMFLLSSAALAWAGVVLGQLASSNFANLREAAEKGDPKAQSRLGDAYAGSQDCTNAFSWYKKAAAQGDAHSEWQLGRLCEFGAAPDQADHATAVNWYLKAAEQGDANAQFDLGQICEKGTIARADRLEAFKWYTLASTNHCLAKASRDRLALKMQPLELLEAQKRVHSFTPVRQQPKPVVEVASAPIPQEVPNPGPAIQPALRADPIHAPPAPPTTETHGPASPKAVSPAVAAPRFSEIAAKLHLKGISAFGSRRAATINDRSLLKGDEAALSLDGQVMRVRCSDVRETSAVVEVAGIGSFELQLVR